MMSESFDPNRYEGERYDGMVDDEINKMKLALESSRNSTYDDDDGIGNDEIINPQVAVRGLQFQRSHTTSSISSPQTNNVSPSKDSLSASGNVCANSYTGLALAQSKLDSLKTWGLTTYKVTRQALQERLGKTNRTVDVELEQSIDALRDVQRRYTHILTLARALAAHFSNVITTQKQLGDCFTDMAAKEPDLREEFSYNAETQKTISKNGETLLTTLNFFISSLNTLCDKTIEDTILTIKVFEIARLEYDAHRSDLEQLQQTQVRSSDFQSRLHEIEKQAQEHKQKYEQLRDDVQIKMRFLHENKVKVMQKQLLMLHNATSAFYSGNNANLEAAMKQFSIKPKTPTSNMAWLEG